MAEFTFRVARREDAGKVNAFNDRLLSAGETYHRLSLELPFRTMKHDARSPVKVEKLLCFDANEIRGGVNIKRMPFQINGSTAEVAFPVYPLSEGIIDARFRHVGLLIQAELQKRYPLVYGLGGYRETRDHFQRATFTLRVPLHFTVLRPFAFLRNINYLRKKKWLRLLCDAAAFTGAGNIGFASVRLFQKLARRCPLVKQLTIHRFDYWEDWADEVWDAAKDEYALIGDRSKAALETLYPAGHEHLIKLCFQDSADNRTIGWAVITASRLSKHSYFGNMRVGAIVDMLALPQDAYSVASGSLIAAQQAKADMVIVSHSDRRWNEAFKRAGMLPATGKDRLSLSPQLAQQLTPAKAYADRFYFTRGDGHGPTSLWLADYHSLS